MSTSIFEGLTIKPNQCVNPDQEVCSAPNIAKIVEKHLGDKCETELCVLKDPKFIKDAKSQGITPKELTENLENFKVIGPRNSLALLNNLHIDGTLINWAEEFDFFFPCPFAMMDFETTKEPFSSIFIPFVYEGEYTLKLNKSDVKRKNTCFACVVNTDNSSGPGKHWTAAFVDMRDPNNVTVEYFNSVANPPRKPINRWLEKTKKELMTPYKSFKGFKNVRSIPVVSVDHQQDDTECGVYSLFYIRRRLEGTPYTFFQQQPISDNEVSGFRKYLFAHV